ncbi:MAG: hypothetical protein M1569_03905, partial [Candidatus Marsarchaeota archaeon]|nr:hypothetical protein [Candidatus Marsarchaeota archaeon]
MRISQIIFAISTMLILSSIASAYYVTVQSSPAGSGYEGVASTAVGYTCLSNQSCTYNFTSGTALTFYAYNFSNTTFTQWSGVGGAGAFSSSSGTAQTTLDSNITETASFQNTAPSTVYHLTIQNNCQSCGSTSPAVGTHAYASGTQVNLNEYP